MPRRHEPPRSSGRVAEPVQVYLDRTQRTRLARLAERLGTTKSEVLRRALEALERELTDPAGHPALSVIGIASSEAVQPETYDVAREHDRCFADVEDRRRPPRRRRGS